MFNRLRNRFLLMNMIIITFIMFVAFGTIYTITYRNVQNDIRMDLHRMADSSRKMDGLGQGQGQGGPPKQEGDFQGGEFQGGNGGPRFVAFEAKTDADWRITEKSSRFELDDSLYAEAVEHAAASRDDEGQFTIDGTRWAYSVMAIPTGYSIFCMDVTPQQNILTNLIYTFSAVALVMLGVIYLASRYFAGRSIAPVKEAFEKQKQFIADASHELKTPLAVINTNADVLLANGEDTINDQAKWLHHIKSETERMKTLTNDLLYLTQMDDARASMIHVPFDLSDAVDGVILTMEAVFFEKELTLEYEIEPGLTVTGSSEQMKQVVMILLDNALKYTNPHGSIQLSLKRHHGHIQLAVSNSGPGIASEHLDRIFDRFYRADASRARQLGGYGLGLAIAKSIVEQHRGKITAKSVPNELTTFTVQLD
ncbi:sensor histidine kinase [Paenibacillus xanthanilyticus]|uniref:histidine kinase n=1 Tax=Paenibacillus xanthanilyticus TaxID=1783531 RepID=A0ABV8K2T3_9BACL